MGTQSRERGSGIAEAAITLPVLLLVMLALFNMAIYGFAGIHAANAANFGARAGSVAQSDPVGEASAATWASLDAAPVGTYAVSVTSAGPRGSLLAVQVAYRVPNYFQGLAALFGGNLPAEFQGTAVSYFRKEGW